MLKFNVLSTFQKYECEDELWKKLPFGVIHDVVLTQNSEGHGATKKTSSKILQLMHKYRELLWELLGEKKFNI